MKKIISILMVVVILVSFSIIPVNAASYPLVFLSTTDSENTGAIPYGEKGKLIFQVMREYNNEKLHVEIYNKAGQKIASATSSYGSSTSAFVRQTITVDTKSLEMSVGEYTVKYWMEFYSFYEWHTAPNSYTGRFKVIKNVCNGNHKMAYERTITEADCETEGCQLYSCTKCEYYMYRDVLGEHKYGAWQKVDETQHKRVCSVCSKVETTNHTWNKGTITLLPTETTSGTKLFECTGCEATYEKTINKCESNNHIYTNSCDRDCDECGDIREITHTFKWVVDKKSTCGAEGIKHEECTICHEKRNENTPIPIGGEHKYSNNCDASCNVCKATRTAPHSYKSSVTKATTSKNGKITKTCSGCKKKVTSTIYYAKSFSLSATSYTYNGKVQTPTVTVKDAKGKVIDPKYYTLSYSSGRKNVGTYKIKVTLKGNYSGSKTLSYKINPISISKCKVSISGTSYTYNGKTIKPSVKVLSAGGSTLKNGTHYTVSYSSGCKNPGTYKVTVKMKGTYSGSKTFTYKINKISISSCKISLSATSYTYDGKTKTPTVTVKTASGSTLKKDTHYTVTYSSGRKNVGTYKVTIKMKGNYTGSKTISYKINPPKTSISKVTADIYSLKVSITKKSTQVTGYEIQYSVNSDFSDAVTKTITSYNTTSATLSELTDNTTYYVRVRTYKTVSGVKYYSGWSTVVKSTTKVAPQPIEPEIPEEPELPVVE